VTGPPVHADSTAPLPNPGRGRQFFSDGADAVRMGEIGEPQREIEAPAPVRTPERTPAHTPTPAKQPAHAPQPEPVPA